MQYTTRTITASQSRLSEAERYVGRQRKVVQRLEGAGHPADSAVALMLVMEQSLLSIKQFLSILERDLERSLGGAEKPQRSSASRHRSRPKTAAEQVAAALQDDGTSASVTVTADCEENI